MSAYTVELYGQDVHVDLDDAELHALVRVAVALNEQTRNYDPIMNIYEGHVEPSYFGKDGAFVRDRVAPVNLTKMLQFLNSYTGFKS